MSSDLANEIEAISAIYDDRTIRPPTPPHNNHHHQTIYIFSIPQTAVSIRLHFPSTYPTDPPQTRGVESTGTDTRKGYGNYILGLVDEVLESVFEPGTVCLFDLVQELEARLSCQEDDGSAAAVAVGTSRDDDGGCGGFAAAAATAAAVETSVISPAGDIPSSSSFSISIPRWYTSSPLTSKKSTFLARATAVHGGGPAAVHNAIAHLRATDKKTAKATHLTSAYRIRDPGPAAITYEDCDDDGESAAGGRLLRLLQRMEVWDVLVVVSRWYGGVKLGGERFRLIDRVAREAVVGLRGGDRGV